MRELQYCVTSSIVRHIMTDATYQGARDSILQELRRGALVLAVLGQLDEERYGYSLKKSLAKGGLDVDEGTLYPLLRRLEAKGLLDSDWRVEDGRPRRYYRLNDNGRATLDEVRIAWNDLTKTVEGLL